MRRRKATDGEGLSSPSIDKIDVGKYQEYLRCIGFVISILVLAACQGTPQLGQGGSMAQGTAGPEGATSGNATPQLERCTRPVGTAALAEPEQTVIAGLQQLGLGSPVPVVRLLMAQSGCFRVVDRGLALEALERERRLTGNRAGSQLVAANYIVTPNVVFSNPNAGGLGAAALLGGAFLGPVGLLAGAVAGSLRMQEAQTVLFLTDARTGVQEIAAEGSAKVTDFGGAAGLAAFGGGVGGLASVSGYGNTAEGKLIVAAFIDAHNKLVSQVRGLRAGRR